MFYVAEGTDHLDSAFEGSAKGIGDWFMALYSAIFSYFGWYNCVRSM